ncbi:MULTISPECIES: hypothetical protein [Oceanobacillus]|uniref:hypothetical protein n=1 Tax=Oceanobacillus TaxID=182709 RepID=UPI00034A9A85|nr:MULTISPECIES: hypothetical protein [Oceanobacillus]
MEAILNKPKKQQQSRLSLKESVLRTVKMHKKRTSMDTVMGLIITSVVFLLSLV